MSEIIEEKIEFMNNNKDFLIENLNLISYQLFLILNSDKALTEIAAYKTIQKMLNNKEIKQCVQKDEQYLVHSLLNILNKVAMSDLEKQECRDKLLNYSEYIGNKRKEKLKQLGKIVA